MIQFQFQLDREHLTSDKWAFENGQIKGDLQLYVQGKVFFSDTHFNIVEFSMQLGKWLEAIRHGFMRDFVYEPLLNFTMQEDGVQLTSTWQQVEMKELVPLEILTNAVTRYLHALNVKLHEMDYFVKLDRYLHNNLSDNAKALMLFEQNEYDAAFALLKKLAEEQRDVQSLNNLAWMYLHEEEDADEAKRLLEEVITLNPQSPFPYMMLGEITLKEGQLNQAKAYLQTAIALGFTEEAVHNLAIVHFKQGDYVAAAVHFAKVTGDSGITRLHEVVSWMYAGEHLKAKKMLDNWNEEAYDYTGATEIADVYMEMEYFSEVREQFEKEWHSGINSPYLVSRFAYTLMQLGDTEACQTIISTALEEKRNEIVEVQEEECDEHWTKADKVERIEELMQEKDVLESLFEQLQNGYVPAFEYEFYLMGGCQLFGCQQHGNDEYRNVSDNSNKTEESTI